MCLPSHGVHLCPCPCFTQDKDRDEQHVQEDTLLLQEIADVRHHVWSDAL